MAGENVLVIDDSPTILKVVQLALTKAGYGVQTAVDGPAGLDMARQARPDLILLDFVMPKMNGYQVCNELRDDEGLRDVPVLLMSAKGEEVGERFVKVTSVVDYITKPFSPDALVTVVSHTIEKHARGHEGAVGAELSLLPLDLTPAPAPHAAPAAAPGPAPAEADLAGRVAAVSVADVLGLIQDRGLSGVLTVTQGDARVEVFTRAGRIDFARAMGVAEEFLLGRFAVEVGPLTRDELGAVLEARRAAKPSLLLGADLVQRGLLTPAGLRQAVARQTTELVHEIVRFSSGTFVLRGGVAPPPEATDAHLDLPVDALLLEGFRRVDEWRLIEREIENFDLVFVRDEERIGELGRGRLTREETTVLELVNGRHTVKDIIRQSRMGSFDAAKMLFRLLRLRLVRRRVMPVAV